MIGMNRHHKIFLEYLLFLSKPTQSTALYVVPYSIFILRSFRIYHVSLKTLDKTLSSMEGEIIRKNNKILIAYLEQNVYIFKTIDMMSMCTFS